VRPANRLCIASEYIIKLVSPWIPFYNCHNPPPPSCGAWFLAADSRPAFGSSAAHQFQIQPREFCLLPWQVVFASRFWKAIREGLIVRIYGGLNVWNANSKDERQTQAEGEYPSFYEGTRMWEMSRPVGKKPAIRVYITLGKVHHGVTLSLALNWDNSCPRVVC
jgi:hypothetical protein